MVRRFRGARRECHPAVADGSLRNDPAALAAAFANLLFDRCWGGGAACASIEFAVLDRGGATRAAFERAFAHQPNVG